ncbi:MAG: ATP-binding protein [Halobacteria archaeon]
MTTEGGFDETVNKALKLGTNQLEAEYGLLTKIDINISRWEVVASTNSSNGQYQIGSSKNLDDTFCKHVLEKDGVFSIDDPSSEGRDMDSAYQKTDVERYVGVPVSTSRDNLGTLCFVSDEPSDFSLSPKDKDFILSLGELLSFQLEFKHMKEELEMRTQMVNVFGRILRHNLRNYMTFVQGYLDLLIDTVDEPPLNPERVRAKNQEIMSIVDKSTRFRELVQDDFRVREYDINQLVREVAESVKTEYPYSQISVETEVGIDIRSYPTIRTALRELIENAVKHSEDDPRCKISTERLDNGVQIHVKDEAPGLPEQERRILRGEDMTALKHGSGVGLWIVSWIVSTHDGELDIEVTEEGTLVSITLPN